MAKVLLKLLHLSRVKGIKGVRGRERVDVVCHAVTPRQSRSRMIPSRIRVLIVPSGAPSRSATSGYVKPP